MKKFTEFINENINTPEQEKINQFLSKWIPEFIIYRDLDYHTIDEEYDKDVQELSPIEIEVVDYDYDYQINFWDNDKLLKEIKVIKNEDTLNHYLKKYGVKIPHYTEF